MIDTMPETSSAASDTEAELPIIQLARPIIGFDTVRQVALVRTDDAGVVCELKAIDGEFTLVVVPPEVFFGSYSIDVDDETVALLGITDPADVLLLVVLTLGDSLASSTANLAAPLVISRSTMRAAQIIVEADGYGIRTPVLG